MKIPANQSSAERRASRAKTRRVAPLSPRPSSLVPRPASGFTMVEIAICLAIIGIGLVAIIGVLPLGINVQKANNQESIIDQDHSVFMENIRTGTRGLDDLTNYVYAIVNTGSNPAGYTNALAGDMGFSTAWYPTVAHWQPFLTNGQNIVGLMATPEYTAANGFPFNAVNGTPIPSLVFGGVSNHIVAYVRSLSGPAADKPPQDNPTILAGSFGYKIICVNAPMAVDTNLFFKYPVWGDQSSYPHDQRVFWNWAYWQPVVTNTYVDPVSGVYERPDVSRQWAKVSNPGLELIGNLRELRLTFLWPLLPNGSTGPGHHTFATTVAGQLTQTNIDLQNTPWLYFFQPNSFTSAP